MKTDTASIATTASTINTKIGTPASSVSADIAVIDGYFDVPTADTTTNSTIRDIVGNKTDAAVTSIGTTKSLVAYVKGILSLFSAPSVADNTTSAANSLISDLLGRKDDTASTTVNSTTTITRYIKGIVGEIVDGTSGLAALESRISDIEDNNAGTFDPATDNLRAIRLAISSLGGATPTIKWSTNVPSMINVGEQTMDLIVYLTNQEGTAPLSGQITAGTVRVREWVPGSGSWVSRLAATAMSKANGKVYYTGYQFNGTNGFSSGNQIEIEFSGISVTIASKTYDIPTITIYSHLQQQDNPSIDTIVDTAISASDFNAAPVTVLSLTPSTPIRLDEVLLDINGFTNTAILTAVFKIKVGASNNVRVYQTTTTKSATNTLWNLLSTPLYLKNVTASLEITLQSNNGSDTSVALPLTYFYRSVA